MKKKALRPTTLLTLLALAAAALAVLPALRRGDAKSPAVSQASQKTLRELAKERDVTWESPPPPQFSTFDELVSLPHAIVRGRITDTVSFFGASDHPPDDGDFITTEYTVEISRVLKGVRLNTPLGPGQPQPLPLTSPLKVTRNGGVVHVGGRRAEVRVKGSESLRPGHDYVLFLFWSPDYKSYILAGDLSGVVVVNGDLSLKPLASSEDIRERLRGVGLETLAAEIGRRN